MLAAGKVMDKKGDENSGRAYARVIDIHLQKVLKQYLKSK